jgi:hypothetical protein
MPRGKLIGQYPKTQAKTTIVDGALRCLGVGLSLQQLSYKYVAIFGTLFHRHFFVEITKMS